MSNARFPVKMAVKCFETFSREAIGIVIGQQLLASIVKSVR